MDKKDVTFSTCLAFGFVVEVLAFALTIRVDTFLVQCDVFGTLASEIRPLSIGAYVCVIGGLGWKNGQIRIHTLTLKVKKKHVISLQRFVTD